MKTNDITDIFYPETQQVNDIIINEKPKEKNNMDEIKPDDVFDSSLTIGNDISIDNKMNEESLLDNNSFDIPKLDNILNKSNDEHKDNEEEEEFVFEPPSNKYPKTTLIQKPLKFEKEPQKRRKTRSIIMNKTNDSIRKKSSIEETNSFDTDNDDNLSLNTDPSQLVKESTTENTLPMENEMIEEDFIMQPFSIDNSQ